MAFWDAHGRIERHLKASGLPAVILQPSTYMTNVLASAEAMKHTGKLFAPADGARIAIIEPRDVGAVAAAVLTEDGHEGRTYVLTGPAHPDDRHRQGVDRRDAAQLRRLRPRLRRGVLSGGRHSADRKPPRAPL